MLWYNGVPTSDYGEIRKFKEKVKRWKSGPVKERGQEAINEYMADLNAYKVRVGPMRKARDKKLHNDRARSQSLRQPDRPHKCKPGWNMPSRHVDFLNTLGWNM